MCAECRRRSLEGESNNSPKPVSSLISPRPDTIIPKQESFMGALSYHKPSIISQNATSSAVHTESSNDTVFTAPTDISKSDQQTAVKPKAVMCPGGTYFPCNGLNNNNEISPKRDNVAFQKDATTTNKDDKLDVKLQENDCSYAKIADLDFGKQSEEFCEKSMYVSENVDLLIRQDCASQDVDMSITNVDSDVSATNISFADNQIVCNKENLYTRETRICNRDNAELLDVIGSTIDSDSCDTVDSASSSSNESCPSPRQVYLNHRNGLAPLTRRSPNARYKRIRRKLKKLLTRSRPCTETVQQEVILTQAEREQDFLLVGNILKHL